MSNHFAINEDYTAMRVPGTFLPRFFKLKNGYSIIVCAPATLVESAEIDGEPYTSLSIDTEAHNEFIRLFAHFLDIHELCQLNDDECDDIMKEMEEEK